MNAAAARRALLAAAIFGVCDGMMSTLGVVLDLRAHPGLVPGAAAIGGIGAGWSMAVGRYVSEDNEDGVAACAVLGAATTVGSVLPALPYAGLHGSAALWTTSAVCQAMAAAVALLRAKGSQRRAGMVFGLLFLVFAITLGCAMAAPGGA